MILLFLFHCIKLCHLESFFLRIRKHENITCAFFLPVLHPVVAPWFVMPTLWHRSTVTWRVTAYQGRNRDAPLILSRQVLFLLFIFSSISYSFITWKSNSKVFIVGFLMNSLAIRWIFNSYYGLELNGKSDAGVHM